MGVPLEIKEVDEEINKELLRDLPSEPKCFYQVGPGKCILPSQYAKWASGLYNFKLRPTDIYVATFPRSGTTLVMELTWLVVNDSNFELAERVPQAKRFPHYEFRIMLSDQLIEKVKTENKGHAKHEAMIDFMTQDAVTLLDNTHGQRFMKTHFPLSVLPPGAIDICKLIYVCRHPKDVAVSFYLVSRTLVNYDFQGDFAQFWKHFENGYFRFCPYWEHVRAAWEKRDHPNMLFLFYDDVVKDMENTIKRVAAHLNKQMTNEQVKKLADYLHIDNFRRNKSVNMEDMPFAKVKNPSAAFIRQGKIGGWTDYFTPELNERADKWIEENMKKLPGFSFPTKM